jgi:hypothetical protein
LFIFSLSLLPFPPFPGVSQTDCILAKTDTSDFPLFTYAGDCTAVLRVSNVTVLMRSVAPSDGVFYANPSSAAGSIAAVFVDCRFTMDVAVGVAEIYGAFYITHAQAAQASLRVERCTADAIVLGRVSAQSFIVCGRIGSLEIVDSRFGNMQMATTAATLGASLGGVVFSVQQAILGLRLVRSVCVGIVFDGQTSSTANQRGGGVGYLVGGSMTGTEEDNVVEDCTFWNCTTPKGQGGAVLKIASNSVTAVFQRGIKIQNTFAYVYVYMCVYVHVNV